MINLVALAMAAELARTEIQLQKVADAHYTQQETQAIERFFSYDVHSLGEVKSDIEEFRAVTASVLTDDRGWKRAGAKFVEVKEDGQLHVVLASPAEIGALAGCSAQLSCTVGNTVYINDDRWAGGNDKYTVLGVDIPTYRAMVLNHEVGHFLGHGHSMPDVADAGKAPVMIARPEDLNGCSPSAWPLPSELEIRK